MTKSEQDKPKRDTTSQHVHTFRSELDKSVGVSVWLADAPGGGPAYLYYEQARAYDSKQTKKPAYSKKFFSRNAEAHAAAILAAATFMEAHASNPEASLEAAAELRTERTARINGEAAAEAA